MAVDRVKELVQEGLRRKLSGDLGGAAEAWAEAQRLEPDNVRAKEGLDELRSLGVVPQSTALRQSAPSDAAASSRKNPFSRSSEPTPFNPTPSPFANFPSNATPLSLVIPEPSKALPSPTPTVAFGMPTSAPPPVAEGPPVLPPTPPAPPVGFDPFNDLPFGAASEPASSQSLPFTSSQTMAFGISEPPPSSFDPFAKPQPLASSQTMAFGLGALANKPVDPAKPEPVASSQTMAFGLGPNAPNLAPPGVGSSQTMAFGLGANPPSFTPPPGAGSSQTMAFGLGANPPSFTPPPGAGSSQTMAFGLGANPASLTPPPGAATSQTMAFGLGALAPNRPLDPAKPEPVASSQTMAFGLGALAPNRSADPFAKPEPKVASSPTLAFGQGTPNPLSAPAVPSSQTMAFGFSGLPVSGDPFAKPPAPPSSQTMAFGAGTFNPFSPAPSGPTPQPSPTLAFGSPTPPPVVSADGSQSLAFGKGPNPQGGFPAVSFNPAGTEGAAFPSVPFEPSTLPFGQKGSSPAPTPSAPVTFGASPSQTMVFGLTPPPPLSAPEPEPEPAKSAPATLPPRSPEPSVSGAFLQPPDGPDELVEGLEDIDEPLASARTEDESDFSFARDDSAPPVGKSDENFDLEFGEQATAGADAAAMNDPAAGFDIAFETADPGLATSTPSAAPLAGAKEPDATDPSALLVRATDLLDLDDYSGAMAAVEKVLALDPSNATAQELKVRCEQTLLAMYESKLGDLTRAPTLRLKPDEVVWLNLDHRAGFLLSMIDGQICLEDLFTLSSMSRLETARILLQLVQEKVIA